jgi:DNA excision repair protein ERCC-8
MIRKTLNLQITDRDVLQRLIITDYWRLGLSLQRTDDSMIPVPLNSLSSIAQTRSRSRRVSSVRDMALFKAASGQLLLTVDDDGNVRCFNIDNTSNTALLSMTRSHQMPATSVNWYPDGGIFVTTSLDGSCKVWDATCLQEAISFDLGSPVNCHDISTVSVSHSLIACATLDNAIRLCDLRTGSTAQSLSEHSESVLQVKYSPFDEYLLCSSSLDGCIILYDIRSSRAPLGTLTRPDFSMNCRVDLKQHHVDDILYTADFEPGQIRDEDHEQVWAAFSSSSTKRRIQQQSRNDRATTSVSSAIKDTNRSHNGAVNSIAFVDGGFSLVSYGHDNCIRLWDVCTGSQYSYIDVSYSRIDM